VTKESWNEPVPDQISTEPTPEQRLEVQSVLQKLGGLLENPAVAKYTKKCLETALEVAWAPTKLMVAGVDKLFQAGQKQINPAEADPTNSRKD